MMRWSWRFWISLGGAVLVTAGPVFGFWRDVQLDIASFVEEWVKIGVSGILLVILLDCWRAGALARERRGHWNRVLQSTAAVAAELGRLATDECMLDSEHMGGLERGLAEMGRLLETGGLAGTPRRLAALWADLRSCRRAASELKRAHLATGAGDVRRQADQLRGSLERMAL